MLLNLVFPNNTILSCFFLLFLIFDCYILTPEVIIESFNPHGKLAVPKGIPTSKSKAKLEIYPVVAETEICNC